MHNSQSPSRRAGTQSSSSRMPSPRSPLFAATACEPEAAAAAGAELPTPRSSPRRRPRWSVVALLVLPVVVPVVDPPVVVMVVVIVVVVVATATVAATTVAPVVVVPVVVVVHLVVVHEASSSEP